MSRGRIWNSKKNENRNYHGTFRCPEVGLGIPITNEHRNSRGTFSCPEVSAVAVGPPRLARDREKAKKRLLRSPRSMGGLARGRVRPDCKEGSRKRNRVAATTEGPVYIVLIVSI